jgi:hypothetical protein
MPARRKDTWLRGLVLAGLCYCLVLQGLLVQAAGIAAATADAQIVLCHGNGDQGSGGPEGDPLTRCRYCWLPVSGAVLLPEAGFVVAMRNIVSALAYSSARQDILVTKPPPRGASRAPPASA